MKDCNRSQGEGWTIHLWPFTNVVSLAVSTPANNVGGRGRPPHTFDLPVLEDADSIQVALGQIMRMIVCRQVDTPSLKDSAMLVASHYNQRQSRPPCLKTLHNRP